MHKCSIAVIFNQHTDTRCQESALYVSCRSDSVRSSVSGFNKTSNRVITVAADALAPNDARSSAATAITVLLNMKVFKVQIYRTISPMYSLNRRCHYKCPMWSHVISECLWGKFCMCSRSPLYTQRHNCNTIYKYTRECEIFHNCALPKQANVFCDKCYLSVKSTITTIYQILQYTMIIFLLIYFWIFITRMR